MKNSFYLLFVLISCFFVACGTKTEIMGWVPVYATLEEIEIKNLSNIPPIENAGKIYIKEDYFYQIENGKGIHVIDVSNKENPQPITFIQTAGVQEISIKGDNLYVNSFNDLVVIDIADIHNVRERHRITNTFHLFSTNTPPSSGYFECVDEKRGTVISWKEQIITNPKCRY
jgi:hypothetical protein